jgi:hypothetical protein
VFFAHGIAAWLGIPTGVVIVIMLILRKRLRELRVRHKQHRQAAAPAGHSPRPTRGRS